MRLVFGQPEVGPANPGGLPHATADWGGLKAGDAKRLRDPSGENSTLKRLLADARAGGAGRNLQGDCAGQLLSPERRRAAVHHLMTTLGLSERFACQVTGQQR